MTTPNLSATLPSARDVNREIDRVARERAEAVLAAGYAPAATALRDGLLRALELAPGPESLRAGAWMKMRILEGRLSRTLGPSGVGKEPREFARVELVEAIGMVERPRSIYPEALRDILVSLLRGVQSWPDSWTAERRGRPRKAGAEAPAGG